ncbi:putative short chain dehydrogenease [Yersinia massiliensis]|nr:putative short chain dehydrogenease [Yersinia massiliensis]
MAFSHQINVYDKDLYQENIMVSTTQQVAIITGASRGIGAAIAERLARDGYTVLINYSHSESEAEALVRKIQQTGGKALSAKADISNATAVAQLFATAEAAFGGVDVLVNNAGILSLSAIADSDDEHFDRQVAINLKGSFNGMREAAKRLKSGGRIVNFSTSVVGLKLEKYGVYAATKAAVETMTAILAKELRGRQITVNAVAPGPTATDLFLNGKSAELIEKMAKMAPLERLGTPEDIAAAVAFLVSEEGGWINGQVLRANGGLI